MLTTALIILIIFVSYYAMIVRFVVGWNKLKNEVQVERDLTPVPLSCIVAFRNEEAHLTKLIEGLKAQKHIQFEVILIDDNSTDSSWSLAEKCIAGLSNFRLIKSKGQGKKAALATAVTIAHYNYIIFTDADCLHTPLWLSSMAQSIQNYSAHLLVGPVRLQDPHNFFELFQTVDFLSLVTSGAGAIGSNSPIMCNGANLAVSKEVWLEAKSSLKEEWASGDDIFLLQYCKAHKKTIAFVALPHAIVTTYPAPSITTFFKQRARWAYKSTAYTDYFTLAVAWLVLMTNVLMLALPLSFLLHRQLGFALCALSILKIALDYILIKRGARFFKIRMGFLRYLGIAVLYPVYIFISVLWATLGNITWKNRKV